MPTRLLLRTALAAALAAAALPAAAQTPAPALKAGDTWTYRGINDYNRLETGTWTREVTAAAPGAIRVTTRAGGAATESLLRAPGEIASGPLSDRASGALAPALQTLPFPLAQGGAWSQKVVRTDPLTNERREMLVRGRVLGWETVRVPAGEFKAIRVERTLYLADHDSFRGATQRTETEWYAPEVRGAVKLKVFEEYCERRYGWCGTGAFMPGERATYELTSFRGG